MTPSYTARIAAHFKRHRNRWIPAVTLLSIGGALAWRSRIAEARKCYRMKIENRERIVIRRDGTRQRVSEYRYVA